MGRCLFLEDFVEETRFREVPHADRLFLLKIPAHRYGLSPERSYWSIFSLIPIQLQQLLPEDKSFEMIPKSHSAGFILSKSTNFFCCQNANAPFFNTYRNDYFPRGPGVKAKQKRRDIQSLQFNRNAWNKYFTN